jgi:acyl-CoA thioesterase FadM
MRLPAAVANVPHCYKNRNCCLDSNERHAGHMNVMWYVGKFDEATWQFFNTMGLSPSHLRSASRGMAAVDQHVSYIEELRAGDVVTIRTTLIEFKEKSLRFLLRPMIDELVAAKSKRGPVLVDCHLPHAIEAGRPQHIPAFVAIEIARIAL